jgi:hypothetical protein
MKSVSPFPFLTKGKKGVFEKSNLPPRFLTEKQKSDMMDLYPYPQILTELTQQPFPSAKRLFELRPSIELNERIQIQL